MPHPVLVAHKRGLHASRTAPDARRDDTDRRGRRHRPGAEGARARPVSRERRRGPRGGGRPSQRAARA